VISYIRQAPVPIDPILTHDTQQASESNAAFFGVAVFQNALYSVCTRSSDHSIQIYRSQDMGATWQPLAAAGAPISTGGSGTATYNLAAGIVYIAYLVGSAPGNIEVVTFNLFTLTWGIPSAASSGTANSVRSIYFRPDGSLAVIYTRNANAPTSGVYADFLAIAGTWAGEIDAFTNITTLSGYNASTVSFNVPGPLSCMGADGSIYVFCSFGTIFSPSGWINRIFYQRITPANTVPADSPGSFYDFPGQGAAGTQPIQGQGIGKPCIAAGAYLILPVCANASPLLQFASLYYAPLLASEATTWIATGQQIDPLEVVKYPTDSCAQIGPVIFDGSSLFVSYLGNGAGNVSESSIKLSQAPYAGGLSGPLGLSWTTQLVWDAAISPNPNLIATISFPSIQRFASSILVQADGEVTSGGFTESAFWFGDWSVPRQVQITLRGVNRRQCD